MAHMWRSEENSRGLALSFYLVAPRIKHRLADFVASPFAH